MKSTDIQVKEASTSTQRIQYRSPIKFGGRVVEDAVIFNVEVVVETRSGLIGRGCGSMPMGNVWAWPSTTLSGEQTLSAMTSMAQQITDACPAVTDCAHPLLLTHRISQEYDGTAQSIVRDQNLAEPMPRLAQLVAASPLEAAIHDAFGNVADGDAYNLLGSDHIEEDLSFFLDDSFTGEYLDSYTLRRPKEEMPLYHLVGALDPLTNAEVQTPIGDGLPESLAEWMPFNGLTHLKIKLAGDNIEWDVQRVVEVDRVAEQSIGENQRDLFYSTDFNERCANVDYVLEFLRRVEEQSKRAYDRVQYIEQPTHRDLRANPENRMHAAAKTKPVVIDESLVDYESLLLAREQGYSGVALKACKGHSEALLMGAAAQKLEMFLCVQDLTCVGASFLHSASLAARIPTVAAIEGNGRQYCPAGNRGWDSKYPGMFQIDRGVVRTGELCENGLGFSYID